MAKLKADPFDSILTKARKKYDLAVGKLGDIAEDTAFVPTGNIVADYVMGEGLPLGRSIEISGRPSSGKTTLSLQAAGQVQKHIISGGNEKLGIKSDDKILYLDYEQAIDPVYTRALGLDVDHDSVLFSQPDSLEDGANLTIELLETGRVRLVVVDSVAAMIPSAQAEKEVGQHTMAVTAKLMKAWGQKLNPILARHKATIIFINHEYATMQAGRPGMPPPTTTSGGNALKYFASIRLQVQQMKQNKSNVVDPLTGEITSQVTSTDVRLKAIKNKVAPPFREGLMRVRFGKGFDNFYAALIALVSKKKIMHSGGMYYFHKIEDLGLAPDWMQRAATGTNRPYIKGADNLYEAADAHPEWREKLIQLATDLIADSAVEEVKDEEDEEEEEVTTEETKSVLGKIFSDDPTENLGEEE